MSEVKLFERVRQSIKHSWLSIAGFFPLFPQAFSVFTRKKDVMVSFYTLSILEGDVKIRKNFVSYLEQQRYRKKGSKTICLSEDFSDIFYLPQTIKEILDHTFCPYSEYLPGTGVEVDVYRKNWWRNPVVTWREQDLNLDTEFYDVGIALETEEMEVVGILCKGGNFLANEVNPLMFRTPLALLANQWTKEEGFEEDQ